MSDGDGFHYVRSSRGAGQGPQGELASTEVERQRALTALQKGYMSEAELDTRMRGINERADAYAAELLKLESAARDYEQRVAALDEFMQVAERISDRLDDVNADEQTQITHAMVSRVTIGEDVQVKLARGPGHVSDDTGGVPAGRS